MLLLHDTFCFLSPGRCFSFFVCVAAECCHGEVISLRGTGRWHQCLGMLLTSLKNGCCYLFVNLMTLLWLVSHRPCASAASWRHFYLSMNAIPLTGDSEEEEWKSTGSKNQKRPEKYMPEHRWYNQGDNTPNPIHSQSFWASTEWLTCTDSCLHMIYGSGALPQKRRLLLDSVSHTDKTSAPVLTQPKLDTTKTTGDIKPNNTLASDLCGSDTSCSSASDILRQMHPHCAHRPLFIFQLPHV